MEIVNFYEIAAANFVIALNNNEVSTQERENIRKAIGNDVEKMIDTLNLLIVGYSEKVFSKGFPRQKAALAIKAEYKAIGLDEILSYSSFEKIIAIFFEKKEFPGKGSLDRIKEIYKNNRGCKNERVKTGVDCYCLRLLSHGGLVTSDLTFTKALMETINAYTRQQIEQSIMPSILVTEL